MTCCINGCSAIASQMWEGVTYVFDGLKNILDAMWSGVTYPVRALFGRVTALELPEELVDVSLLTLSQIQRESLKARKEYVNRLADVRQQFGQEIASLEKKRLDLKKDLDKTMQDPMLFAKKQLFLHTLEWDQKKMEAQDASNYLALIADIVPLWWESPTQEMFRIHRTANQALKNNFQTNLKTMDEIFERTSILVTQEFPKKSPELPIQDQKKEKELMNKYDVPEESSLEYFAAYHEARARMLEALFAEYGMNRAGETDLLQPQPFVVIQKRSRELYEAYTTRFVSFHKELTEEIEGLEQKTQKLLEKTPNAQELRDFLTEYQNSQSTIRSAFLEKWSELVCPWSPLEEDSFNVKEDFNGKFLVQIEKEEKDFNEKKIKNKKEIEELVPVLQQNLALEPEKQQKLIEGFSPELQNQWKELFREYNKGLFALVNKVCTEYDLEVKLIEI